MKVLHVIPSVSPARGGPSFAIESMTRHLARLGLEVEIATTDDDGAMARLDVPLNQPVMRDGVMIRYFERQSRFYGYSRPLTHWLEQRVRDYDLVHIHALFSHTSTAAGLIARRRGVPYIVRPLGVLNRWGMQNRRRLLKSLSFRLLDKRVLDGASLVHYTSESEKEEAEAAGVTTQSIVLPLGIDTEQFENIPARDQARGALESQFKTSAFGERPVILFLSRLDPKKGLDLLLPAFALLLRQHPNALLLIAGEGEASFVSILKAQATSLGIADAVTWMGFVAGQKKLMALGAADVFVLPSYSENFGIAAAEAMACGLPCVLSDQVGFAPLAAQEGAAIVVRCEVEPLSAALQQMIASSELRQQAGAAGARLARQHFSNEAMAHSLVESYVSICSEAPTR